MTLRLSILRALNGSWFGHTNRELAAMCAAPEPSVRRMTNDLATKGLVIGAGHHAPFRYTVSEEGEHAARAGALAAKRLTTDPLQLWQ